MARPRSPAPSATPGTRRALLRASCRRSRAPRANAASPPTRRGRRPRSSRRVGGRPRSWNCLMDGDVASKQSAPSVIRRSGTENLLAHPQTNRVLKRRLKARTCKQARLTGRTDGRQSYVLGKCELLAKPEQTLRRTHRQELLPSCPEPDHHDLRGSLLRHQGGWQRQPSSRRNVGHRLDEVCLRCL
jgi:hypothetical protein